MFSLLSGCFEFLLRKEELKVSVCVYCCNV